MKTKSYHTASVDFLVQQFTDVVLLLRSKRFFSFVPCFEMVVWNVIQTHIVFVRVMVCCLLRSPWSIIIWSSFWLRVALLGMLSHNRHHLTWGGSWIVCIAITIKLFSEYLWYFLQDWKRAWTCTKLPHVICFLMYKTYTSCLVKASEVHSISNIDMIRVY